MVKNIILGVTGCIAAYKAIDLTSHLKKQGFQIKTILTQNACEFVRAMPFMVLSKNKVYKSMFNPDMSFDTDHIELAKWGDTIVIYPATANIIGKIYSGISDDLLSTVIMAMPFKKKIICPAMNTRMYENPIVSRNIKYLKSLDTYVFIGPVEKTLACGDRGMGALCPPEDIIQALNN